MRLLWRAATLRLPPSTQFYALTFRALPKPVLAPSATVGRLGKIIKGGDHCEETRGQ